MLPTYREHQHVISLVKHARTRDEGIHGVPWWLSLWQGRYEYVRYLVEDEFEELDNIDADPQDLTNLAVDARYHAVIVDYRTRMYEELVRTDGKTLADNLPELSTQTE